MPPRFSRFSATTLFLAGARLLFALAALSGSAHASAAQTLTIVDGGETGTSGTNWSLSGGTLTVTGTASIDESVVDGALNSGGSSLLIVGNTGTFNVTVDEQLYGFGTGAADTDGYGLTIGSPGNAGDIVINDAIVIRGSITLHGDSIALNSSLTAQQTSDISLLASGSITGGNSLVGLNTGTGPIPGGDVLLAADTDATSGGRIEFTSGLSITTHGGDITLGGGDSSGSGYAVGTGSSTAEGIRLDGNLSLTSSGGDIALRGEGWTGSVANSTGAWGVGWNSGGASINSGTGTVEILGVAKQTNASSSALAGAIHLAGSGTTIQSNSTSASAIVISGDARTSAGWEAKGVRVSSSGSFNVYATGSGGGISIASHSGPRDSYSIHFDDPSRVLAASGPITITADDGTSGADFIVGSSVSLTLGSAASTPVLSSSSDITLRAGTRGLNWPSTVGFDVADAVEMNSSGAVAVVSSTKDFDVSSITFGVSPSSLSVGDPTGNTGDVRFSESTTIAGPITIYGGAVVIDAPVTATNDTIRITASGAVTDGASGYVTADGLELLGTGRAELDNTANNVTRIAASGVAPTFGPVVYVDADALRIGPISSSTGVISKDSISIATINGDLTVAGDIGTAAVNASIRLYAGRDQPAGTTTGGDIKVDASAPRTITLSNWGLLAYSGSEANTTDDPSLTGGVRNYRYGVDKDTDVSTLSLTSGGRHGLLRGANTVPSFANSTPSTSDVTTQGFDLTVEIDEPGTISYVVVADGATAPSVAEVQAGQASGGAAALASGDRGVTGASSLRHTFSVTGLNLGTDYDVYVAAQDSAFVPGVQASPTLVNVATSSTALAGLVPSAGSLSPSFASGTTSYTLAVPFAASKLTLTPTVASGGGTVTVEGVTVTSGQASGAVDLAEGSNTLSVVVTGLDGVTTATYTLTVTRAALGTGALTMVASGGASEGSGWAYDATSGMIAPTSASAVSVNASELVTALTNGDLEVLASSITVNGDITSGTANTLTLRSEGDIMIGPGADIATSGGDVVLWSNTDGGTINGGVFFDAEAGVTTSGGHIWIGGSATAGGSTTWNGLTVGDGLAVSGRNLTGMSFEAGSYLFNWEAGVFFDETTLSSAGGNIYVAGKHDSNVTHPRGAGIINYSGNNGILIDAGTGTVTLIGESTSTTADADYGFMAGLHPGSYMGDLVVRSSSTSPTAIRIEGTTLSSVGTDYGLMFEDQTRIVSLGASGGAVELVGSTGGGPGLIVKGSSGKTGRLDVLSTSGDATIDVGDDALRIDTYGDLTLGSIASDPEVASSAANVEIISNAPSSAKTVPVRTTGSLTVRPKSGESFSSLFNPSFLSLAGVSGLTIGTTGNTAGITFGASTTIAGPITVHGGDVAIDAPVTATNDTIRITASGAVTDGGSGYVTADGLELLGTGRAELDHTSNNVARIASSGVVPTFGPVVFVDADALRIGPISSSTGVISKDSISIATINGDLTVAGDVGTSSASANIRLFAGRDQPAGTTTGGDVKVDPNVIPSVTLGSTGIMTSYSGSLAASTGLTGIAGGSLGNARFGIDESTDLSTLSLSPGGRYALYRGAGASTQIAVNAGDGQSAQAAAAVATAPSVIVRDAGNNPVSGVSVTFAVASGGGTIDPASPAAVITDANGVAALTSWTLGPAAGANTLTASVTGSNPAISLTFTATADATAPVITGPSGGVGASASSISVAENQTAIHTLSASEAVTWSKAGGSDAASFSLNTSTGALTFASAPNFERPQDANGDNTYVVTVRATDGAGNTSDQTVSVSVTDVNEVSASITVYALSFTTGELISYETNDPAGTRTTLLTGGSLVSPASLVMGPDGNLYIGENGDGSTFAPRISKFEPATLTLSTIYAFSAYEVFPASLAFQGNDLLIGRNPAFSNTGPIVKLTNATGGVPAVSDYTTGGSLASSPGIALAADGRLYVSDQTYNFGSSIASGPVKRFDTGGAYVGEVIADGASGLAGPNGMAINGTALYTSSLMTGKVLKTDLTTDATTEFLDVGAALDVGPLAVLSNGEVLVASPSGNGKIYHAATDGTLLGVFASGLGQVGGVATVGPQVPTAVTLTGPSSVQAGATSSNFTLTVVDATNSPVNVAANTTFSLTTSDQSGTATFTPSSVTVSAGSSSATFTYSNTRVGDGTHTLTATRASGDALPGGASATLDLTVTAPPAVSTTKLGQDGISAVAGTAGVPPPAVRVIDVNGDPVAGESVTFGVTAGAGTLAPAVMANLDAAYKTGGSELGSGASKAIVFTMGPSTAQVRRAMVLFNGPSSTYPASFEARVAVHAVSGGEPGAVLTQSDAVAITLSGSRVWHEISFPAVTLAANQSYALVLSNPGSTSFKWANTDGLVTPSAFGGAVVDSALLWVSADPRWASASNRNAFVLAADEAGANSLTVTTSSNGVAAIGSWTLGATAGANSVTATHSTGTQSFAATGLVGTAAQLAFTTQPSASTVAGTAFAQQPAVEIQDANGNRVTTATDDVTLALTTGAGTLSGTLTVTAVNGVATFSGLSLDLAGADKVLTASATGLTSAVTSAFAITPGAATQLVFTTEPSASTVAGSAFAQQPVVEIRDANGNRVTSATDNVTLTLTTGSGTLSGTTTVAAVAGVATFSGLSIDLAGADKVLMASATGLTSATTSAFAITVGAVDATSSTLASSLSSVTADGSGSSTLTVTVVDAQNNPVSGASVFLASSLGTLSAGPWTTDASGEVSATLSSTTVGSATITAYLGTDATGTSIGTATVDFVAGAASQVVFTTEPSASTVAGSAFAQQPVVEIHDANGNLVTSATDNVTLTLTTGSGTLSGTTTLAAVAGVATFSGLSIDLAGADKVLTASATGLTSATTGAFAITVGAVDASASRVSAPAGHVVADGTTPVQVTIVANDTNGNPVPGTSVFFTTTLGTLSTPAALVRGGATGPLVVASPWTTDANGRVTAELRSTSAGSATVTGYLGTDTTGASIGSATVNFVAGAATQLVFTTEPSASTVAGSAFAQQPVVEIRDTNGNVVTTATDSVTLALTTGMGTLSGSATVAAVAGVATFSGLSIDLAGADKVLTASSGSLTAATTSAFTIVAGTPDVSTSTFAVSPTTLAADGTSAATLELTVRDAQDNPVSGAVVFFATDFGTLSEGPWTTDANGQASAELTSTLSGTATVMGYLGADATGTEIGSGSVVFEPGLVDAARSSVRASDSVVVADGEAVVTIEAVLRDANGNVVPRTEVELLQGAGRSTIDEATRRTNERGEVRFVVRSAVADTITYTVRVLDEARPAFTLESSATVIFTPVARLEFIQEVSDETPALGDTVTVRYEVRNTGSGPSEEVVLRSGILLPRLEIIEIVHLSDETRLDMADGTWTIPGVAAGQSMVLEFTAVARPGGER